MKILISGANGVVGSDLVKFFSKKNKVYAIYRSSNFVNKKMKSKNIFWIKHDLIKKIKVNFKPDIVIHCAVVHSFSKKNDKKNLINSNILGLLNILDFCNQQKVKKIFHLSSINVYGEIKKNILNEKHAFQNPDLLGISKIMMEKIIQTQKIDYLNLRLPGIVGYQINDPRRPWISKILNLIKNNKKVSIFNSNKNFNNIVDTYEIYRIINYFKNKKNLRDTVNFSASNPIKLYKIIELMSKKLNSRSKIIYQKKKTKHFILSNSKLRKLYNFEPSSTKKIIKRYIEIF